MSTEDRDVEESIGVPTQLFERKTGMLKDERLFKNRVADIVGEVGPKMVAKDGGRHVWILQQALKIPMVASVFQRSQDTGH